MDAKDAGRDLLSRFVTARGKDRSFLASAEKNGLNSTQEAEGNGYFEAVAEGAHLSNMLSASKKGLQNRSNIANISASGFLFGTPDEKSRDLFYTARKPGPGFGAANAITDFSEPETIEMLRLSISKLLSMRGEDALSIADGSPIARSSTDADKDKDTGREEVVEEIIVLLQGVEEQLEGVAAAGLDIIAKQKHMQELQLSPVDKENSVPGTPATPAFEGSGMHTPFVTSSERVSANADAGETPEAEKILKTYMNNQLELNQEEMREYEAMIENLTDKLEDTQAALESKTDEMEEKQQQHEKLQDSLQEQLSLLGAELLHQTQDTSAATNRAREHEQIAENLSAKLDELTGQLRLSEESLRASEAQLASVVQSRSPNTKLLAAMAEIVAQSPNKEDTTAAVSPVRAALDNALEATEAEQVQFDELANKLLAQLDERNTTIANMQRNQENLEKQVQEAQADIENIQEDLEAAREEVQVKEVSLIDYRQKEINHKVSLEKAGMNADSLQALVVELREKDAQAEDFISEMKEMNDEADEQLAMLQGQLTDAAARASNAEDETKTYKKRLAMTQNQIEEDNIHRKGLEEQITVVKEQLKSMGGELGANVSVLTERLEQLQKDKEQITVDNKNQEQALSRVKSELELARSISLEQQQLLAEAQEEARMEMEQREMLWRELQEVIRSAPSVLSMSSPSLANEKWTSGDSDQDQDLAQNDSYHLNNPFADPVVDLDDDSISKASTTLSAAAENDEDVDVSQADYQALAQRLVDAEQRAAEASEKGAGQMATSLRATAILDAELSRMRALGDHFKTAHTSLVVEHKAAREQAIRVRGLERQLHTTQAQVQELEAAHEVAVSKQQVQAEETFRRFEQERDQLHELRTAAQTSADEHRIEAAAAAEEAAKAKVACAEAQEDAVASARRVEELQAELDIRQQEAEQRAEEQATIAASLEQAQTESQQQERALLAWKQEKENVHLDWHAKHSDLQEDFAAIEGELAEATTQLSMQRASSEEQEQLAQSLKQQLHAVQSELKIARKTAHSSSQEAEEASAALEAAEAELAKRYASIQRLSDAADEWQRQSEEAKLSMNNEKQRALAADNAAKSAADEAASLSKQLSAHTDELRLATEATKTAEARLQVLHTELDRVQSEDMATLESARVQQRQIQQQLQAQLEQERTAKLAAEEQARSAEQTSSTFKAAEQAQTALVSSMQQRSEQLQQELRQAREGLAGAATADVDAALEMHSLVSQMTVVLEKTDDLIVTLEANEEVMRVVKTARAEQCAEDDAEISIHEQEVQEREASNHSIVHVKDALPSVTEQMDILKSCVRECLGQLIGTAAAASALQRQNDAQSVNSEAVVLQLQALQGLRDSQARRIGELEQQENAAVQQVEALRTEARRNSANVAATSRRSQAVLRELHSVLRDTATHALRSVSSSISPATADAAHAAKAAAAAAAQQSSDDEATTTNSSTNTASGGVQSSQWETVLLEVERATSALGAALEEASVSFSARQQIMESQRKELEEQQQAMNDASLAAQSAVDMIGVGSQNQSQSVWESQNTSDVSRLAYEHSQLRVIVAELGRGKEALEAEGQNTINMNADLRSALSEAERLCEGLKSRNRSLQANNDALSAVKEQQARDDHVEGDSVVELERAQSELMRLRADNEVLMQLQQSLEGELERTRTSASSNAINGSPGSSAADVKTMDCERLLGSLYSTVDQMVATGLSGSNDADAHAKDHQARLHELQVVALSQAGAQSMSNRLDSAVQYMSELRVWAREEQRCKHALLARVDTAAREVSSARTASDDAAKLTQQLRQHRDRDEADTRALRRELSESRRALAVSDEALRKTAAESTKLRRSAADERARVGRLSVEEQARGAEITRLRHEAEAQRQRAAKAIAQLSSSKEALEAAQAKATRLARENSDLMAQVNALPVDSSSSASATEKSSSVSAKSIAEAGGAAAMAAMKERLGELKTALQASKGELRAQREACSRSDATVVGHEQEVRTLRRKVELAEKRCDTLTNEKYLLQDEKSCVQTTLAEAQQQLVVEQGKLQRAEAMAVSASVPLLPAVPDAVEANAGHIDQLRRRLEEADGMRKSADNERSVLRTQLAQLLAEQERQHSENLQQHTAQRMAEAEMSKLRSKAERLQRELSANKDEAATGRTETRRLRRIVLEASSQVREATNVMRAEAAQTGAVLSSPEPVRTSVRNGESEESADSLGLAELRSSLAALREGLAWLRHGPQQRTAMQEDKRQVEAKLRALESEYDDFRVRGEQEISQARAEVKSQQARAETARAALRQARSMESDLREKMQDGEKNATDRANRAETEVGRLRARLEQLEQQPQHHSRSNAAQNEGPALHSALQELRAVEHHRSILRGVVERLESQLKLTADGATQAYEAVLEGMSKDQESAVRQAAKYRARASAMEQVVQLYRTGIMALYPDGNSYSAAHYDALLEAANAGTVAGNANASSHTNGWMELEISAVRQSFEAEMRLADSECVELRGKLRQADAFSVELTRRFEESVNMQFGKRSSAAAASGDVDGQKFTERTMSAQAAEITELRKSLADEKDRCRRRHRHVVDTLGRAAREKNAAVARLKQESGDHIPPPHTYMGMHDAREISPFKFSPTPNRHGHSTYSSFVASSPAPEWIDTGTDGEYPASPAAATAPVRAVQQNKAQKSSGATGFHKLSTNDNTGSAALRVRRAGK